MTDAERVAVGLRAHDAANPDGAPGASDVFDDDRLTERDPHAFPQETRDGVGWSAGRGRHDDRNRPRRIGLGVRHYRPRDERAGQSLDEIAPSHAALSGAPDRAELQFDRYHTWHGAVPAGHTEGPGSSTKAPRSGRSARLVSLVPLYPTNRHDETIREFAVGSPAMTRATSAQDRFVRSFVFRFMPAIFSSTAQTAAVSCAACPPRIARS